MEEDKHLTKRERKRLAKEKKHEERESSEKMKKIRTYGIWVVAAIAVVFAGYKLVNWINTPTVEVVEEPVEVTGSDWVKGSEQAQVTIIEYSDFQCPACKAYEPIVKRLGDEFSDSVRVVYRHFPLQSIHPNAFDAAKAAEAAGKQGKFWEMHDELFDKQEEWSDEGNPKNKFKEYAEKLELDIELFENDYDSGEIEDKINEHIFQANRLGLKSTPSFILNDQKIDNPRGFEAFKSLIEENLSSE